MTRSSGADRSGSGGPGPANDHDRLAARTPLLEGLFGGDVAVVEVFGEPPPAVFFPGEEAAVAAAVDRRRREFAAVRDCARTAMQRLGAAAQAIPVDLAAASPYGRRAPIWPPGLTGSMTHCAGYYAAALATRGSVTALGVDAEPAAPLPDGVLEVVALPDERARIGRLRSDRPGICWDRLLFSAKESVFKAWYPLARDWLGFDECRVELKPDGSFHATVLKAPAAGWPGTVPGRWAVCDTHLATSIERRAAPRDG